MSKIFLSADAFQRDCARLARLILHDSWKPQLLLPLWRGGAQPGVILSEIFAFLGQPTEHRIVQCASYTGIGEQAEDITLAPGTEAILQAIPAGTRVLVIDDVFDSGRTAEAMLRRLAHTDARTAMVYWKPKAAKVSLRPDYYLKKTDEWIVFPHELQGLTEAELSLKDPELREVLRDQADRPLRR